MNKEEVEKEYKEILKKTKKQYFSRGIITIFLLVFLLYINKFILLVMIDLFLGFFFSIEYFVLVRTYKNIYDYCTLRKEFSGKKEKISSEKFKEMLEEGIPANTYFAIDGVILAIECNQKYFYVNFLELSSKEDVLKLHLGDKKVKDAKNIYLLMYDSREARSYFVK